MLPTNSIVRAIELHHQELYEEAVRERAIEAAVNGRTPPRANRPVLWAIPLSIVVVAAVAIAIAIGDPAGAIRAIASGP